MLNALNPTNPTTQSGSPSLLRSIIAIIAILALLVGLTGCKPSQPVATTSKGLRVVATTAMVGDIVKRVGGEHVQVEVMMGPGTDPHLYKPTPGDLRTLQQAQLIAYSGLKLEGKMIETLEGLSRTGSKVMCITDGVPREKLLPWIEEEASTEAPATAKQSSEEAKHFDPHVWFDVALWEMTVDTVRDALGTVDPSNAGAYAQNAQAYASELTTLDQEVRNAMTAVAKERRLLVTAHDAFGYFGRAYDIEVMGIQGLSTESEASLHDINRIVDELVARKVPAVFIESSINPRNIEALVQGAKAKGHNVRIGGSLFSDAMGDSATPEGTYVGMVRHNVRQITEALK